MVITPDVAGAAGVMLASHASAQYGKIYSFTVPD
jgi:hypothetical protein